MPKVGTPLSATAVKNFRNPGKYYDQHDYGYVEELYEKLEYINHRVDELEERLEE